MSGMKPTSVSPAGDFRFNHGNAGQQAPVAILQDVLGRDHIGKLVVWPPTAIWITHQEPGAQRNIHRQTVASGVGHRRLIGIERVHCSENEDYRLLLLRDGLPPKNLRLQQHQRTGQHQERQCSAFWGYRFLSAWETQWPSLRLALGRRCFTAPGLAESWSAVDGTPLVLFEHFPDVENESEKNSGLRRFSLLAQFQPILLCATVHTPP